jgi:HD-GYP domain-containing protein (c-di-GMP phosphodiesterase class II)
LITLVDRDIDVALFGCMRQDDHRFALYALTHGVHSAVLGLLTARQLGWSGEHAACLVKAALTMNTAMSELQAHLAEQRDPPSKRQLDQIRAHPHASAQLLRQAGVTDADWLSAVEDHHERPDAGGYPRGVKGVSDLATLLRAADVFMAKISPRAFRAAMSPQLAARQLFQQDGGAPLATALIRAVGVYPPGSLVLLASGEVGVVTHRAMTGRAAQVATLSDRKGHPAAATQHRDTAQPEFAVTGPPKDSNGFTRVLPERIYGLIPA